MCITYLTKTPKLEFDEIIKFMEESDESFITRQVIMYNNETYDDGFIVIANDNIFEVFSAKHKEIITKASIIYVNFIYFILSQIIIILGQE